MQISTCAWFDKKVHFTPIINSIPVSRTLLNTSIHVPQRTPPKTISRKSCRVFGPGIGLSGEHMNNLPNTDPSGDFADALTSVAHYCGMEPPPGEIERAAAAVSLISSWEKRLEHGASATGLRVTWTYGSAREAAGLVEYGQPVVTSIPNAPGRESWVILSHRRLGRVYVTLVNDPKGGRWMRLNEVRSQLGGSSDARPWAVVHSRFPASPLTLRTRDQDAKVSPIARLLALLQLERRDLSAILIYSLAIGALSLATPLAMQVLINWLAFGVLQQPIIALSIILLGCLGLAAGLSTMQRIAVEFIQRRVFVRMVNDLSARLSRVSIPAFDRSYGPELANRFFDVLTVQKAVSSLMLDGIAAALQALVGLALLATYHPVLLAFDVVIVTALVVVLFVLGRGAQSSAIAESQSKYDVARWIQELARHPFLFKVGAGPHLALQRADLLARSYLDQRERHWRIYLRQFVGAITVQAVATVALLALCGWLVLDGSLTVGQLVAAEFIVTIALAGFVKFTMKLDTFYDLLAGLDKLGQLVDLPQERVTGIAREPGNSAASIAFKKVAYRWPFSETAVGPISFTVDHQQHTAILGKPGSGKSTIAEMILGVRRPSSGSVFRDGINLQDLRPEITHQEVSFARGVDLIQGSIEDNIALGDVGYSRLEVRRAIARVGLTKVLDSLPADLDTQLSPTGAPLSTSQATRLMLARLMIGSPRLVIIDGLLDSIPQEELEQLISVFIAPAVPWTLIVLTESRQVADLLPNLIHIDCEENYV